MAKISCVLPVYNGEQLLAKSIESVINQTYTDWELIIVNDCSTDNSLEIAKKYASSDSRIKIISNPENYKLPKSLNIGFSNAYGQYYTWTSDDNQYYPNAFEKMADFLENNQDYAMVYAKCNVYNSNTKEITIWGDKPATPINLLDSNVCGACFLYRADAHKLLGKYNESKFLGEDHDYWLRMLLKYKIANLDEVLYLYTLHKTSLSGKYKSNARIVSLNLQLENAQKYLVRFPEIKDYVETTVKFNNALLNKNIEKFNSEIKRNKKEFYKCAKTIYKYTRDLYYIKSIIKLGFVYFPLAIIIYFKYGVLKK